MPRGKSHQSTQLIRACAQILREIQPASVRAVCYRLFVQGVIPDMSRGSTNRVGTQLVYARKQRLIPWGWIVDETREAERVPSWDDPAQFSETVKRAYRRDAGQLQNNRVEVWSEKGTVRGTLAPILQELGVTFRVMHGYASATAIHQIAEEDAQHDKLLIVLYVGDFDPSGLHMSAVDLPGRLGEEDAVIMIRRIALTEDDAFNGGLPHFDVASKRGDPRFRWYLEGYGERCWELDAMSPAVLRERVGGAIRSYINWDVWNRCLVVEQAERESLEAILGTWNAAKR